ncbi:hypothetical protein [Wenxinia marina]|uniref:Acyltransferase n=1 Tax=Wenxinia marina DSM 24838 TaxID=1123501 RepID=A0A0D0Q5S7_9RHOB|nr:hypothetical protein [Wenxinia marina]KIQ67842.1 hypothetical protein Wenmar_03571 [Wenxinia marina DSM 24838]GGL74609.1 hypothetical protein GCM10011392_31560 [Wenxinia marina]
MILPLAGLVLGALIGALRARAREGRTADLLQWAAVHALIGALLGLFALIFVSRAMA